MFDKQDDSGVSPVIGVILMVAVTVALVALVTVTVFDLGGDVSESPDATVQFQTGETENGATEVTATLLRNENVDEIYIESTATDGGDTSGSAMSNAGDTNSLNGEYDTGSGESESDAGIQSGQQTINAIAVMPDGSEEVLTSTEVDGTTVDLSA